MNRLVFIYYYLNQKQKYVEVKKCELMKLRWSGKVTPFISTNLCP